VMLIIIEELPVPFSVAQTEVDTATPEA
jgi:hypothetical protein